MTLAAEGLTMNQVVINMYGGLVQDVFCDNADVVVVDWDTKNLSPSDEHVFELLIDEGASGPRSVKAHVNRPPVWPASEKSGTNVEAALKAAGIETDDRSGGLLEACEAALEEIVALLNRSDTRNIDLESLWSVSDQLTREIAAARDTAT